MSVYNINCPQCGRMLNAKPEYAGKTAKCAGCGAMFPIPGPPPQAAPSEAPPSAYPPMMPPGYPAPAMYAAAPNPGWATTRMGISLYRVGVIVIFIAIIPAGLITAIRGNPGGRGDPATTTMMGVVGLAFLGGGIVAFVGQCMCCAVPRESGAKGLVIGSLLLEIALMVLVCAVGLAAASQASGRGRAPPEFADAAAVVQLVLTIGLVAAIVLFVLFLRNTARCLRNEPCSRSASGLAGFIVGVQVLQFGINFAVAAVGPPAVIIGGLVMIVAVVTTIIWYLRALAGVRDAIGAAAVPTYGYGYAPPPGWAGYAPPPGAWMQPLQRRPSDAPAAYDPSPSPSPGPNPTPPNSPPPGPGAA
jgi:hypothetical protein